jgi:hypothetical protein
LGAGVGGRGATHDGGPLCQFAGHFVGQFLSG